MKYFDGHEWKEVDISDLEQPDLDTLMRQEMDGLCQAACPERCRVEPDGYCPHGKPSWLLVKGLI